jgi:hypothetical protein
VPKTLTPGGTKTGDRAQRPRHQRTIARDATYEPNTGDVRESPVPRIFDLPAVLARHDVLAREPETDRDAIPVGMRHPRILESWGTRNQAVTTERP